MSACECPLQCVRQFLGLISPLSVMFLTHGGCTCINVVIAGFMQDSASAGLLVQGLLLGVEALSSAGPCCACIARVVPLSSSFFVHAVTLFGSSVPCCSVEGASLSSSSITMGI